MKIKLNKDMVLSEKQRNICQALPRKPSVWIGSPDQKSLASSHASVFFWNNKPTENQRIFVWKKTIKYRSKN